MDPICERISRAGRVGGREEWTLYVRGFRIRTARQSISKCDAVSLQSADSSRPSSARSAPARHRPTQSARPDPAWPCWTRTEPAAKARLRSTVRLSGYRPVADVHGIPVSFHRRALSPVEQSRPARGRAQSRRAVTPGRPAGRPVPAVPSCSHARPAGQRANAVSLAPSGTCEGRTE